jgi:hypothetical protein
MAHEKTQEPRVVEGELAEYSDRPANERDVEELRRTLEDEGHAPGAVIPYTPAPGNPFDAPVAVFAKQIQTRGENYAALVDWLLGNMVKGEDVVQVHVVKADDCTYGGAPPKGDCTPLVTPHHWSDPDISKRGAEKICGLIGLGTRFLGMDDFRRTALKGVDIQHVIIDCELYNEHGTLSQGTGACSLSEVKGNLNNAMKKAAKRAHVDAVKRCAGLSGLATEIKRRMVDADPEEARRAAEAAASRARIKGQGGRWNTGAELTHCPIGKQHKDKAWGDIPSSYLAWILRDVKDKPDVVAAAARELERRKAAGQAGPADPNDKYPPKPGPGDFDDDIPF